MMDMDSPVGPGVCLFVSPLGFRTRVAGRPSATKSICEELNDGGVSFPDCSPDGCAVSSAGVDAIICEQELDDLGVTLFRGPAEGQIIVVSRVGATIRQQDPQDVDVPVQCSKLQGEVIKGAREQDFGHVSKALFGSIVEEEVCIIIKGILKTMTIRQQQPEDRCVTTHPSSPDGIDKVGSRADAIIGQEKLDNLSAAVPCSIFQGLVIVGSWVDAIIGQQELDDGGVAVLGCPPDSVVVVGSRVDTII